MIAFSRITSKIPLSPGCEGFYAGEANPRMWSRRLFLQLQVEKKQLQVDVIVSKVEVPSKLVQDCSSFYCSFFLHCADGDSNILLFICSAQLYTIHLVLSVLQVFLPTCITLHFSRLNYMFHFSDHLQRESNASCIFLRSSSLLISVWSLVLANLMMKTSVSLILMLGC